MRRVVAIFKDVHLGKPPALDRPRRESFAIPAQCSCRVVRYPEGDDVRQCDYCWELDEMETAHDGQKEN